MKILVTGGAGYIGSVLVPKLLMEGHEVTVLDNFMYGQTSLNGLCLSPYFDVVRGDARDESVVRPLLKSADAVIPLAALVGAPLCDSDRVGAMTTNCGAVDLLTRSMSRQQWMLIPITNSGYGVGESGECTEESPLRPISLYGQSKVAAEAAALSRENSISFRLATVFGMSPRMRLDLLVNDFVWRAVHDRAITLFEGHFRRNYLHVADVARVFKHGLENFEAMRGQAYNVGLSSANLSKRQLCEVIAQYVPQLVVHEAEVGEDPDKRDYVVSNAKIEATGWKPNVELGRGVVELVKGYRMLRNSVYGNA